ncbi:MAG: GDSL-type esterase/lipase family protein [Flavitalea sp.]
MKYLLLGLALFCGSFTQGQNKVLGILGSSTAAGFGASAPENSWVNKVTQYYTITLFPLQTYNLASGGYDPYHGMPTGFVPPAGRPSPDINRNITKVLTYSPDVVIISFVSNNFNVYSFEEIKSTLNTIYTEAINAGRRPFVTTTQPRTSFSQVNRQKLRDIKDSIVKWYGIYSINFFDPLVDPVDLSIKAEYRYSGDQVHINDAGHEVLFQQVIAKDIFLFTLNPTIRNFNARRKSSSEVLIGWSASDESPGTIYTLEKKSGIGGFKPVAAVEAKNLRGEQEYNLSDTKATGSNLQYRLKIAWGTNSRYSNVIYIQSRNVNEKFVIRGNPATSQLNLLIESDEKTNATIFIHDLNGRVVIQQPISLMPGSNLVTVPVSNLPRGQYITTGNIKDRLYRAVFQKQ